MLRSDDNEPSRRRSLELKRLEDTVFQFLKIKFKTVIFE